MNPRSLHQKADGQGIIEYAFILTFVSIVAVLVMASLGEALLDVFQDTLGYLMGI